MHQLFGLWNRKKRTFNAQLQDLCKKRRSGDKLVVLGDVNARVGTRDNARVGTDAPGEEQEISDLVLGRFGLSELNDNGRLLSDCCRSQNGKGMRVISTYFQHRAYRTWQHNRTKQWHQIDHVLPAPSTAAFFTDVKAMPGLDFDSDHRMVRVSLRVVRRCKQPWGRVGSTTSRFGRRMPELNISALQGASKVAEINERFGDFMSERVVNSTSCAHMVLGGLASSCWAQQRRIPARSGSLIARRSSWLSRIKAEAFAKINKDAVALAYFKTVCKQHRVRVVQILNEWWEAKSRSIQEAVDRKEPNYQFKGYQELRRVLHTGGRPPSTTRDSKETPFALKRVVFSGGKSIFGNCLMSSLWLTVQCYKHLRNCHVRQLNPTHLQKR